MLGSVRLVNHRKSCDSHLSLLLNSPEKKLVIFLGLKFLTDAIEAAKKNDEQVKIQSFQIGLRFLNKELVKHFWQRCGGSEKFHASHTLLSSPGSIHYQ